MHYRFQNDKINEKPTKNQQISKIVPYLLTLHTYGKYFPQHTTTTHRTCNFQKTPAPWSPPPAGVQRLQFYRWVRSPYIVRSISITAIRWCNFLREMNCFFLFYWLLFYRPLTGAHWDRRYVFLVNTCAFFWPLHRINAHWPQLSADLFFAGAARVLIMFWHDFGRGE